MNEFKVSVSFAWWLKPYIFALACCAVLAHRVPDQDKLSRVVKRAMRVTVR
jgi:hypothetical protein